MRGKKRCPNYFISHKNNRRHKACHHTNKSTKRNRDVSSHHLSSAPSLLAPLSSLQGTAALPLEPSLVPPVLTYFSFTPHKIPILNPISLHLPNLISVLGRMGWIYLFLDSLTLFLQLLLIFSQSLCHPLPPSCHFNLPAPLKIPSLVLSFPWILSTLFYGHLSSGVGYEYKAKKSGFMLCLHHPSSVTQAMPVSL